MNKDVGYLASISDGFSASAGDTVSLFVILSVIAAALVWSAHYHNKRRDTSPFDPL